MWSIPGTGSSEGGVFGFKFPSFRFPVTVFPVILKFFLAIPNPTRTPTMHGARRCLRCAVMEVGSAPNVDNITATEYLRIAHTL